MFLSSNRRSVGLGQLDEGSAVFMSFDSGLPTFVL